MVYLTLWSKHSKTTMFMHVCGHKCHFLQTRSTSLSSLTSVIVIKSYSWDSTFVFLQILLVWIEYRGNYVILKSVLLFFSLCESQGANTRKRGRLSHMLKLIYLKVFFKSSKSWCMDSFSFLSFFFTFPGNCVGYFERNKTVVIWILIT